MTVPNCKMKRVMGVVRLALDTHAHARAHARTHRHARAVRGHTHARSLDTHARARAQTHPHVQATSRNGGCCVSFRRSRGVPCRRPLP